MVRPPQHTRRHYERRRAASRTLTSGHSESRIEYTAESLMAPSYATWAALTTPSSRAPSRSIAARAFVPPVRPQADAVDQIGR